MDAVLAAAAKPRRVIRKYTDEQRRMMVAESLVVGATVRAVAQRHGVRPNLLSYWRRRSRAIPAAAQAASGAARFAAVAVAMPRRDPADDNQGVIEIDLQRSCVRVRGVVDAAMLREVLAALR
jgi:transposase